MQLINALASHRRQQCSQPRCSQALTQRLTGSFLSKVILFQMKHNNAPSFYLFAQALSKLWFLPPFSPQSLLSLQSFLAHSARCLVLTLSSISELGICTKYSAMFVLEARLNQLEE